MPRTAIDFDESNDSQIIRAFWYFSDDGLSDKQIKLKLEDMLIEEVLRDVDIKMAEYIKCEYEVLIEL